MTCYGVHTWLAKQTALDEDVFYNLLQTKLSFSCTVFKMAQLPRHEYSLKRPCFTAMAHITLKIVNRLIKIVVVRL